MLRLISAADLVQRKGLALSFQWLSQFMIGFETADAIEAAAANSMAGNYCEPAFNEVAPRRAARRNCRWTRGWEASHSFTVLPEPRCHGASSGSICRYRAFPQRNGARPTQFARSYRLFPGCVSFVLLPCDGRYFTSQVFPGEHATSIHRARLIVSSDTRRGMDRLLLHVSR
jgi:hypothetical protein